MKAAREKTFVPIALPHHRRRTASDAGFTLIEVLVAMSMSLIIGMSVVTIVIASMNILGVSQAVSVADAKTQAVLNSFGTTVREADSIKSVSKDSLVVNYRTENRCERHTWTFTGDPEHAGRMQLSHTILALTLPGTLVCAAVDPSLSSGTIAPQTSRVEITNLGAGSRFTYFDSASKKTSVLGDEGFNATQALPLCQIASVSILLQTPNIRAGGSYTNDQITQVAVRNNARGLSC